MRILGISAFYHDSAAALVDDGRIMAAAQEERFSRRKHDARFPRHAVEYCLREGAITLDQLDHIVFYDKPFLKFERLLETYVAFAPRGLASFSMAVPLWVKEKLFQKLLLKRELEALGLGADLEAKLLFAEHHQSHAASAFFPSPFAEAAVLTMDGVGEWATTSMGIGRGNSLEILKEIHFPHSLGLLYSAFTYYTGFKVNSGEYKLMGLAPYGEPKFAGRILDQLIDLKPDGSFRLNLAYFDYCTGLRMTNARFDELFGGPPRDPDERLTQRHMDIAASIQAVTDEVALNCVTNGRVLRDGRFTRLWIQPAAGDAGGALGAALCGYHLFKAQPRTHPNPLDAMEGSYLGPWFAQEDVERRLKQLGAVYSVLPDQELIGATVGALVDGRAVGWFQGRMEFGPRALGARSILGDPRSPTMQSILNLKVKHRESFRPFAPSVLAEEAGEWFDLDTESPYMLIVADVAHRHRRVMTPAEQQLFGIEKLNVPRSSIPAVTHVDYSARIQTVHRETNPRYHALLTGFQRRTGCPVLVNTSFNVRGEPIVATPEDAFHCFMGTEIEVLAIGNCFLRKEDQDPRLKLAYVDRFTPD